MMGTALRWIAGGVLVLAAGGSSTAAAAEGPVVGADLVLWLDAQDLAGKRANPPADRAAVATWADKSGRGNHATQAVDGRRPTFVRDALARGRHAVRFRAAARQCLSAGKRPSLDLTALTAYVVARAEPAGGDMWLFSKNHWGSPWVGYGIAVDGRALRPWPHLGLEGGARGYLKLDGNLADGFRLVEVVHDGTALRTWLDGRRDADQIVRGRILPSARELLIGTLGAQYLQGQIAEILLYRRALNDKERQRTRKYLLARYGLPVVPAAERPSSLVRDWLFQAEGRPLRERARQEIAWARRLAARLAADPQTPRLAGELAELSRLADRLDAAARASAGQRAARELYLAVRRVKRRITLKNPLLDFKRLLLIDQPYPRGSEWRHQALHRLGIRATPGGRMLLLDGLDPNATARAIGPGKPGSYWRPDLRFDADRVVFCFKPHDEKSFHLYEIHVDGTGLRQLTDSDYDDVDPIYLPDGHLLFTTTRGNTYVRCGPYIYSYILARCEADGRNIYLISRNSEPDFVPSLMDDGRVIYSRWEYTDKSVYRVQSLWTTHPNGAGTRAFWGNQSVWPDHLAEPRAIPGTGRVMFAAVGHHDWFTGSIGIVDPGKSANYPGGLTRVTWDLPWPEVRAGPRDARECPDYHSAGRYTSYKTPQPLSEEHFLASARGLGEKFRLYLMDVHGNRELLYEGRHNIWHAMPVRPRPKPPRLPDRVAWPGTGADRKPAETGALYTADVYEGAPGLPRGSAKHLRVLQADAKTYSEFRKTFRLSGPPISVVFEESVKRIVSVVPVEADGSAYFKVPAGQALHFQLLDAGGRCLQTMRSFTGVMPGEKRGCTGCHESRIATPPRPARRPLALRRGPTELTPPPWGAESIGYERFVQPVLDRYCGKCHQGAGKGRKKLDLTLRGGASVFKEPYLTLVGAAGWGNPSRNRGKGGWGIAGAIPVETMDETKLDPRALATLPPRSMLSSRSRLIQIASSGKHNHVKVDALSLRRLIAWVDTNCPYLGEEEIRTMKDPDFPGIERLPIRPRVKTAPVIERP